MALRVRKQPETEARPAPTTTEADLEQQRRRIMYAERRLEWLQRLER
jgi:hypothetical protein